MSDSREFILNSIKNGLCDVSSGGVSAGTLFNNDDFISDGTKNDLVEEFIQKLSAVNGKVEMVNSINDIADPVSSIFEKTKSERFCAWDTDNLSPIVKILTENGYRRIKSSGKMNLSRCDIGITLADYAVSETGTIVLLSNDIQNRNASLIVPIHVAILQKARLVKNIFDLMSRISNDFSKLDSVRELSDCITFITGPSRTADIELNLTLGVHGPKELYVIIV